MSSSSDPTDLFMRELIGIDSNDFEERALEIEGRQRVQATVALENQEWDQEPTDAARYTIMKPGTGKAKLKVLHRELAADALGFIKTHCPEALSPRHGIKSFEFFYEPLNYTPKKVKRLVASECQTCGKCRGSGELVYATSSPDKCHECGGMGMRAGRICSGCVGTGKSTWKFNTQTTRMACSSCSGRGLIVVERFERVRIFLVEVAKVTCVSRTSFKLPLSLRPPVKKGFLAEGDVFMASQWASSLEESKAGSVELSLTGSLPAAMLTSGKQPVWRFALNSGHQLFCEKPILEKPLRQWVSGLCSLPRSEFLKTLGSGGLASVLADVDLRGEGIKQIAAALGGLVRTRALAASARRIQSKASRKRMVLLIQLAILGAVAVVTYLFVVPGAYPLEGSIRGAP